jgi:hypothetical protein
MEQEREAPSDDLEADEDLVEGTLGDGAKTNICTVTLSPS